METTPTSKHTGKCHCGAVRFEVEVDASKGSSCNCSVCVKLGVITSIVKPEAFKLLTDESGTFKFGNEVGHRHFCKQCGIFLFSRGHLDILGGDYVSVSLSAIDGIDPAQVTLLHWDGRHDNWEAGPRPTPWPVHASA